MREQVRPVYELIENDIGTGSSNALCVCGRNEFLGPSSIVAVSRRRKGDRFIPLVMDFTYRGRPSFSLRLCREGEARFPSAHNTESEWNLRSLRMSDRTRCGASP